MAPLSQIALAASTLLVSHVSSVASSECPSSVSENIVAVITNSSFYNTCALKDENVTFHVTNLFDVLNFTSAQFVTFCNSSLCLNPVHEMVHSIPSDCAIEFMGSQRNLSKDVKDLHDKCHKALGVEDTDDDATDSDDAHGGTSSHMGMDGQNSSTTPKTSASIAISSYSFLALAIAGVASVATLL